MNKLAMTALALAMVVGQQASAATYFFSDANGNVGKHDTTTTATTAVGSFASASTVGQMIGLAFDAARNMVIGTDRTSGKIFGMDAATGVSSVLFSGSAANNFQGAAVVGNTLFGIDEGAQALRTFDLVSNMFVGGLGDALGGHYHSLGVDPMTGTLISLEDAAIQTVSMSGTGATVLATPGIGFAEDVDYFGADFLAATYSSSEGLKLIDGTTGVVTNALSAALIDAAGVTGNISGVAVASSVAAVPLPASLPLLLAGVGAIGVLRRRRRA